jgi:hypothetical protein
MPYYPICLDRFDRPHVLDPLSRIADRWFEIPYQGSEIVIVRKEREEEFMEHFIEWCDIYEEGASSTSSRWEKPLEKTMWAPIGAIPGA